MFDFDKAYDPVTDSYLIPKEFITKGIRKNIEQVIENVELENWRRKVKTATTYEGVTSYIKKMWGQNKTCRVPLDEVTTYMLSDVHLCFATGNNRTFVENIRGQGWISLKQFQVLCNMTLAKHRNATWENDNDEELSSSFHGLPNSR